MITTRDLCAYVEDDSKESLDRIATWTSRGLFSLTDEEKYTGRGRVRRYPPAERYWAAAYRRLFDRALTTRDCIAVRAKVDLECVNDPGFVERVATEGRPVWLSIIMAPTPGGLDHGGWTIAADAPSIPADWGSGNASSAKPLRAIGCHADGTPRDPFHRWNARRG